MPETCRQLAGTMPDNFPQNGMEYMNNMNNMKGKDNCPLGRSICRRLKS